MRLPRNLGELKMFIQRPMGYLGVANFMMLVYLTARDAFIEPILLITLVVIGFVSVIIIDSKAVMSDEFANTWDRNPRNRELLENQRKILAELKRLNDDI